MRFQLAAARIGFAALLLGAAVALVAIIGFRMALLAHDQAVTILLPAFGLGAVALVAGLSWLGSALRRNEGSGRRLGLLALAGSIVMLWTPVHLAIGALTYPPIHDAASNAADAPVFVALLKERGPGMNPPEWEGGRQIRFRGEEMTVSYALHEYYQNEVTRPRAGFVPGAQNPVAVRFWQAFEAAKRMGWTIVDFNEKEGRIEATDSSFWLGAKSDIVIRVRAAGASGARTDIRSASRYGQIDYGANIARIKAFFGELRG